MGVSFSAESAEADDPKKSVNSGTKEQKVQVDEEAETSKGELNDIFPEDDARDVPSVIVQKKITDKWKLTKKSQTKYESSSKSYFVIKHEILDYKVDGGTITDKTTNPGSIQTNSESTIVDKHVVEIVEIKSNQIQNETKVSIKIEKDDNQPLANGNHLKSSNSLNGSQINSTSTISIEKEKRKEKDIDNDIMNDKEKVLQVFGVSIPLDSSIPIPPIDSTITRVPPSEENSLEKSILNLVGVFKNGNISSSSSVLDDSMTPSFIRSTNMNSIRNSSNFDDNMTMTPLHSSRSFDSFAVTKNQVTKPNLPVRQSSTVFLPFRDSVTNAATTKQVLTNWKSPIRDLK